MTASAWESMNGCLLGVAERLAVPANFSDGVDGSCSRHLGAKM